MKHRLIVHGLLAVLIVAGNAWLDAQKRPDFSGHWVEDAAQRKSPYTAPGPGGGAKVLAGPPPELSITQTADGLKIEDIGSRGNRRVSYDLTGKEGVNRWGAITETTKTRWEGDKLVSEGTEYQITSHGETTWKVKTVRSLRPNGEMVLEETRLDEDGVSRTLVRVYRKK
jgi:hypothetical protein